MSKSQGNLVGQATKPEEQPQVQKMNKNPVEEETNWVTNTLADPMAEEEASAYNPLRTAVILGVPDSIAGGDLEKASEITTNVVANNRIELSARLNAKAGILPSVENIIRDGEIAESSGQPVQKAEGASFMLLGTVDHVQDREVWSSLRIVSAETGVIVSAGLSQKSGDPSKLFDVVSSALKEAWRETNDSFQKNMGQ